MVIQHPSHVFRHAHGVERGFSIECRFCQRLSPPSPDMHHAVEKAYSAGFSTVVGVARFEARYWRCPVCARAQARQPV